MVSALRASLTLPCSLVSSRTRTSCGGATAKPEGAGGLSHWLYALEPRRSVDGQVVGYTLREESPTPDQAAAGTEEAGPAAGGSRTVSDASPERHSGFCS